MSRRVKGGKAQNEQKFSALPPIATDVRTSGIAAFAPTRSPRGRAGGDWLSRGIAHRFAALAKIALSYSLR